MLYTFYHLLHTAINLNLTHLILLDLITLTILGVWEGLGVDGRTTLRWILGNRVWGCGLDSFGSG
jgi:hypothetical protein